MKNKVTSPVRTLCARGFVYTYNNCMSSKYISFTLRLALAFAFLYPPVAAFLFPDNWIWFVPDIVQQFMPKLLFMQLFGVFEILVAGAILYMKNPTLPTLFACLTLAAIIVLNASAFDVTFRDVSILLAGIALVMMHSGQGRMAR